MVVVNESEIGSIYNEQLCWHVGFIETMLCAKDMMTHTML